ncbi:MAG: GNAT family N-acetyltransferase [Planctomycetes bacterium]|nr:GNAT family N-acetyltransferase [Planctomycetota bacterium]
MTEDDLQLVEPSVSLREEYEAYCREFGDARDIPGNGCMAGSPDFSEAIRMCLDHARGANLPEGRVPATTFWLVRGGRRLVGMINLRHSLTPFLESEGGHIGYSVRPSERRKGYATRMLTAVLETARRLGLKGALITCDKRNAASAGVILKCGGVLENEVPSRLPGRELTQRYWIEL